jgi:hypothetical protein
MLGKLKIEHPEGNTLKDKEFDVTLVYSDNELIMKAKVIKTEREFSTYVGCL